MCGEFVWIIDKVATNSDLNLIWVIFLGVVVNDNLCLCDSSIIWDASDFSIGEVENHFGANRDTFFSLGKAIQLLRHSRNPQVFQSRVVHELCVLGGFFHDWMDNTITDLCNMRYSVLWGWCNWVDC
jgi:hypothetical protein